MGSRRGRLQSASESIHINNSLSRAKSNRRSLDDESVATLVYAFVTSRIDYCNGLLAGAPKVVT